VNWPQLQTIAWLRWRLTRNQWAKGGGVGAAIAAIVAFFGLVLAFVGFGGAFAVGVYGLGKADPMILMAVWLGLTAAFIFIWLIGLLNELQRSETIELPKLLHLPVALGQIFVINYVASHLALSVALFVPAMIGLSIGLAVSRGPAMLLLLPLSVSMVLMITAWTYYLRGWLQTLMSNPRRRRAVIMGISFAVIVVAQAPNFYFNLSRPHESKKERAAQTPEQKAAREAEDEAKLQIFIKAQRYVPPLWVPVGAQGLAEGRVLPAFLGALGCLAIAGVGLRLAYRSTVRFYQGDSGGRAAAKAPARERVQAAAPLPPVGAAFLERTLPGVPEEAAAVALSTFRSLMRAPEVKMQWGASFIVMLLVGAPLLFRASGSLPEGAKPFMVTGVIIFSLFLLIQFLANQFGFDREGFRAFVLSPVDRRLILMGKNLACLPGAAVPAVILMTIVAVWIRVSPVVYMAALVQLVGALMVAGIGSNLLSIFVPYRIQPGSLKPTKMPGLAVLALVVSQLLFPLALMPLMAAPLAGYLWQRAGGPPAAVVNLALSAVIAAVVAAAYWWTLGPLGRVLRRREITILNTVTAEVE
jgi:hypothetical protein